MDRGSFPSVDQTSLTLGSFRMSDSTPRLALPLIQPAQAQKHVTHNEAITALDVAVQLTLEDIGATTPPANPALGQCWALGSSTVGLWQGQDGQLAAWVNGGWLFLTPAEGWQAWNRAGGDLVVYTGGAWVPAAGNTVSTFGINATADDTNRLALASDAALFNHDGSDHRLTINKASTTDTASLIFQSGFSGRAELGLAGSDSFAFKVSADGSSFTTSFAVDPATGYLTGNAIQANPADDTAGVLMRADWGVLRTDIAGTVTQAGGIPTGAIVESGETVDGSYTRFADGTQICSRRNWLPDAAGSVWSYPRPFISQAGISVLATATNTTTPRVATALSTSAAEATVRVFSLAGAGVSSGVTSFATGRWY